MFWELLFLLLPVAAVTGWLFGWRSAKKSNSAEGHNLSPEYYKGLNFLLNEQPDQAAEVFLKVLNVDSETIEVHYALATLFLKRGEVDRAIRIHQNLIARPTLNYQQRNETLYHLANAYFRAGVLDRAEGIFIELQNNGVFGKQSLMSLLSIYQQQRDWERAIEVGKRLNKSNRGAYVESIANYYCEIAETLPTQSSSQLKALKQALSNDKTCARANYINGCGLIKLAQYARALKVFKSIEHQDSTLLAEIVPLMIDCWEGLGKIDEAFDYLDTMVIRYPESSALYCYADLVRRYRLDAVFRKRLHQYLIKTPSLTGIVQLLKIDRDLLYDEYKCELIALIEPMTISSASYCCHQCGFKGHVFHWQCPGYRSRRRPRRC